MDKEKLAQRTASIRSLPVVVNAQEDAWASTFAKDLAPEATDAGYLMAAADLSGSGGLASWGRTLFEDLEIEYVASLEKGYLQSLRAAFSKIVDFLSQQSGGQATLSLAVGIVVDGAVYLGTVGRAAIFVRRNGRVAKVLGFDVGAAEEEILSEHVIKVASGFWQKGDNFIFASGNFASQAKVMAKLTSDGGKKSLQEEAEDLATALRGDSAKSAAAAIVRVEEGDHTSTPARNKLARQTVTSHLSGLKSAFGQLFKKLPRIGSKEAATPDRFLADPFHSQKQRRRLIAVVVLLVLVLVASVFYTKKQNQDSQVARQAETVANEVQSLYDKALTTGNLTERRLILIEAQKKLEQAQRGSLKSTKLAALDKKVAQALSDSLQIKKLGSLETFYDLSIIKTGATGTKMDLDGDKIVVLDSQNGSLYQLGKDNKSGEIIGGGDDVKGANGVAFSTGRAFTFKAGAGVTRTSTTDKKTQVATPPDGEWGEIAAIGSYLGNFYLLDRGKGAIWKYAPLSEASYSAKVAFGPSPLSLSKATVIAIDGAIWVLATDGNLQKIVKDGQSGYTIVGLDHDLGAKLAFYTDENDEQLYILDSDNGRVLVVGKDGQYQKQYLSDDLKAGTDLVVDEKGKLVLVLTGSKIKKIDL